MALRRCYGRLTLSRVFESEAVGFFGDNFYNLVAGFATEDSVHVVSCTLHEIENHLGRTREGPRFGPRNIDLDLLVYGDAVIDAGSLKVLRSEITYNAFVLQPLAEIAGHLRHPVKGERYTDLWKAFNKSSQRLWPIVFDFGTD